MSDHLMRPQGRRGIAVTTAANARLMHDGGTLIDMGGANHGAAIIGHNHPAVAAALQAQARRVLHIPMTYDSPERDAFLGALHALLPGRLNRTFLANSGTEAVECALKLAMAHTGRDRFVAVRGCFHGRTLGALSLMDRPPYRKPFEGRLAPTQHVALDDTESLHRMITPDTAAFVLEPIQGEGGVRPLAEEFVRAARDLTTDRGVLLVSDDVQTGLGRTGTMLGLDHFGIEADIVCLGKGLAGGLPVGACSTSEELSESLKGLHGSTYGGAPIVMAAGVATMQVIEDEDLFARSARLGARIQEAIAGWGLPIVRGVRGRGMMVGIDLRVRAAPIVAALQSKGVLALTAGPTVLRLLPPLTIEEEVLDDALGIIHNELAGAGA